MPWNSEGARASSVKATQEHSKRFARRRSVPAALAGGVLAKPRQYATLSFLIADSDEHDESKHLGVDRFTLERVIAWRSPCVEPMRSRVAADLGMDAATLFPDPPKTRESFG